MNEPRHRKPRIAPGANRVSDEAYQRGQALYQFLMKNNMDPKELAEQSGIHLSTVWDYINGVTDLAKIRQASVEKLLGAMGVTDTWAWTYFDIPVASRRQWRTFRPPPLGHGDDPRELLEMHLTSVTQGKYVLWPGDILTIDRNNKTIGVLLAAVGDDLLTGPRTSLPDNAEVIGQVVRIEPALVSTGQ